MTPWRTRPDLFRLGALTLVAAAIWMAATGKGSGAAWHTPAAYSVDALETLARFQLAHEQGAGLLLDPRADRLGAPSGADWSGYPLPDFPWYWLAGKLVGALGLVPASNVMLMLAHVMAVGAFFVTARVLGQRALCAAGGALLFGFCFSILHRGLSHHSFALAFTVPLAWLVVRLVSSSRVMLRRRAGLVLCAGIGIALGFANPYFIYLFGLMLAVALTVGFARRGRRSNWVAGLVAGGVCLATFAFAYWPFLRATATGLYARSAEQSSLYGLRLLDLVVPPPNHHLAPFGAWGRAAAENHGGEPFAPYLGIVGAAGLLALFVGAAQALARRRRPAASAVWAAGLLAFSIAGGINTWLAQLGLDQFRASNRYSVHLLVLALLFLGGWAARATRSWSRGARLAAVAAVVALGLGDQIPRRPSPEHRAALAAQHAADRETGAKLEAALPPGAAIFQLPVAVFPEQGPIQRMPDYEHLRLFLATRSLRFSYGQLAPSRSLVWQRNVARQSPAELIAALELAGFSAVQIHRAGFPDDALALTTALRSAGARPLVEAGPHVIYRLNPAPTSSSAMVHDPLAYERWDDAPPRRQEPAVLIGEGWYAVERDRDRQWRWCRERAELQLYNDASLARKVRLRFEVTATADATFTVGAGATAPRAALRAFAPRAIDLDLLLQPGLNPVPLVLDAPARRAGPDDPRLIAFNIAQLTAEFAPPSR